MSNSDNLAPDITGRVRDTCLCLHVQRAARAMARRYDEALKPLGITNWQFSLMMSLNRPDPPAMGAVATVLGTDRTTLTASLKPLERRGLVLVSTDRKDRRSRRLQLTPAGQALLAAALPLWERAQAATEELVPASDIDRLRADLRALS
ncbi:MarR family transcriptional regulator [Chelativorans sp.]|uniref:MarR family winged helix-turn-helix transcriptional regulator n=1 Tax=Chelativorans sp. TaxID=2203393 RepID=UPI002810C492|nr:MarR family transcriptional regulator [Chelativorans sp.]